MEVASEHSEAVGQRSGIGVVERLLLNGIALHSAHIAPRNVELSAAVEAHLAHADLAVRYGAAMAARHAADKSLFHLLAKVAFPNGFLQDVGQCVHCLPPSRADHSIDIVLVLRIKRLPAEKSNPACVGLLRSNGNRLGWALWHHCHDRLAVCAVS